MLLTTGRRFTTNMPPQKSWHMCRQGVMFLHIGFNECLIRSTVEEHLRTDNTKNRKKRKQRKHLRTKKEKKNGKKETDEFNFNIFEITPVTFFCLEDFLSFPFGVFLRFYQNGFTTLGKDPTTFNFMQHGSNVSNGSTVWNSVGVSFDQSPACRT